MAQTQVRVSPESTKELPAVGEHVMVQCDGYRCMAYRNKDGKWFATYGGLEIKKFIAVVP